MTDSTDLSTAEIPIAKRVLGLLVKLGIWVIGYLAFAGIIYAAETLGHSIGVSKLGIAGLAVNVVVLGTLMFFFHERLGGLFSALGPVLALLIVILFFATADVVMEGEDARFWTLRNLQTVAMQASPIAVAALGMTLIIIAGGIDLSAGTALALCATVMAWCLEQGYGVGAALAACALAGCVTGLINGALISGLRVVPFIITLGTMTAYLGCGKWLADETTIRPDYDTIPLWIQDGLVKPSPAVKWVSYPVLPNFASGVWIALLLAVFTAVLLHLTVFGRRVFAIGSNESTARLCGINVPLTKIAVYTLAGLFVGIAGVYQFARLTSGNPESGIGMELKIIAAVVIGGGSLSGGQGSVVGTLTGAAIMLVIASGCTMLRMPNATQDIIIGGIIIAAVAVDQWRQRRMMA